MRNRYYAFRHGESVANVERIIISDPDVGVNQYGLTSFGKDQVRLSLEPWVSRFTNEPVIVASDFLRAKETAEIAKTVLGARKLNFSPLLRERNFGPLEGTSSSLYQEVWNADEEEEAYPGVETPMQVWKRLEIFLGQMEWVFQNKEVIIVSHGDVLQILLQTLSGGNPWHHRSQRTMKTAEIREIRASE